MRVMVPTARMRWFVIGVIGSVVASAIVARPYFLAFSFVVRAAGMQGFTRRVATIGAHPETERMIEIPTRNGSVRGRWYEPESEPRRTTLLVPGTHPAGIDEPHLVRLARELAASGVAIVTPDIPALSRTVLTPAITDAIEDAAVWLSTGPTSPTEPTRTSGPTRARDRRVGLIGVGFGGGLAVVAAGRESLRDHVAYVLSVGGHDDLPRVLRYLCTGIDPPHPREFRFEGNKTEAVARPPEPDAVAGMLAGVADRLVSPQQADALRAAVARFILASRPEQADKEKADGELVALRDLARHLPQPSATLLTYVNAHDVIHLGTRLLPYVAAYGGSPALSASRSPKPSAPVFILHDTHDNVIPAIESEYLADDLRGHAPVRRLVTNLAPRADQDHPVRTADILGLVGFWGDLLTR
jgi:dienelactone hydrolase